MDYYICHSRRALPTTKKSVARTGGHAAQNWAAGRLREVALTRAPRECYQSPCGDRTSRSERPAKPRVRAVQVSNSLLAATLFVVGQKWAQHTHTNRLLAGRAMVATGFVLVGVAVLLGG